MWCERDAGIDGLSTGLRARRTRHEKLSPDFPRWLNLVLTLVVVGGGEHNGANGGIGLDITVEMEPGQQFAPGWILSAPRFNANLTYPIIIDEAGVARLNQLHPYEGFNFRPP